MPSSKIWRPALHALRRHLQTPLYANAYYLMGTSAVRSLTGVPFWILAARLYVPSDVGLASGLVSAVTLLAALSTLGLEVALVRFLPEVRDQNAVVNSAVTLVTLCSAAIALASLAALPLWSRPLTPVLRQAPFVVTFCLFSVGGALSILIDQVFVAHRAARFTFCKSVMASFLKIPLPVLLFGLSGGLALFLSVWIPVLLAVAASLLLFLPRIQQAYAPSPTLHWSLLTRLMKYSLSNHAANVLGALPASLFPLMVVAMLGTEKNAYFFAAWTVAQPLFMVSVAVSYSLFAEGSHSNRSLSEAIISALRVTFLILAVGTTLVFILGHRLLLIFGDAYSQHATLVLRVLSLAAFPVAIKLVAIAVYRARKELSRILALSALDAGLSIALVYALIRPLNVTGVGLGLFLSQTVVAGLVLVVGQRARRCEKEGFF